NNFMSPPTRDRAYRRILPATKKPGLGPAFSCFGRDQAAWMLLACFLPLLPAVISKETFWPSLSVLNPAMLMAEKCAKRSSPPPSGVMKPKPFASLNHLTVPVAICTFLCEVEQGVPPSCWFSNPSRTDKLQVRLPSIRKRTTTSGLYPYEWRGANGGST